MDSWLKIAWRGMGPWKWVGIAAIAVSLFLTPDTARSETLDAGRERRLQQA